MDIVLNIFQIMVIILKRVMLQTVVDDADSSHFLLMYRKFFVL